VGEAEEVIVAVPVEEDMVVEVDTLLVEDIEVAIEDAEEAIHRIDLPIHIKCRLPMFSRNLPFFFFFFFSIPFH
jgi:hypothetical protein